jgi:hypothetical protein
VACILGRIEWPADIEEDAAAVSCAQLDAGTADLMSTAMDGKADVHASIHCGDIEPVLSLGLLRDALGAKVNVRAARLGVPARVYRIIED